MYRSYAAVFSAVACVAVLTGCSLSRQAVMDPGFGNTVKSNMAAQIIDPAAGQETLPVSTLNGQKTEQVMKDYRKEKGKTETKRLIIDMGG
jgi:type IV pilus biogenesis protein CpaD/CtpE